MSYSDVAIQFVIVGLLTGAMLTLAKHFFKVYKYIYKNSFSNPNPNIYTNKNKNTNSDKH